MHFSTTKSFFFQLLVGRFCFGCFVYMFLKALVHSCVVMKLQMASYLHICIASKRINDHGLKITSCWCFFGSDRITAKEILKCFRTKGCRKQRNRFQIEKFVVLAENFEQYEDWSRYRKKFCQSIRSPSQRKQSCSFPYQTNGSHDMQLSIVSHVISERHWKSTFDFNEIVNSYWLKRGTICQIVRFISQFSLKLYMQL